MKNRHPSWMIAFFIAILCCTTALATEPLWMTNYDDALTLSRRIEHPLLLVFVSSDHSLPSAQMDENVFNTAQFRAYSAKHFVLVRLDFLADPSHQDPAITEQNERLREKYNVENLPTCIVLDSKERVSKTIIGYEAGGPQPFIDQLVPVESD